MVIAFPAGVYALSLIVLLVFLGVAQRVLDRMKLTDAQALIILGLFIAGSFLPAIPLTPIASIDVGGAIVPLGVAAYLITTAGTPKERWRGVLAAVITGVALIVMERVLPPEPGLRPLPIDIDPVWAPGVVAAIVAYIAGRSRRSAFIAGITGVIIADLYTAVLNTMAGRAGSRVMIGGAGVLDAVVIAGVLAVAICEIVGETFEYIRGGPSSNRPEGLLRGLRSPEGTRTSGEGGSRSDGDKMKMMSGIATAFAIVLVVALSHVATLLPGGEALEGRVHTLYNRNGEVITMIGRQVYRGDEYVSDDDNLYRVFSVRGTNAWVISLGKFDLQKELLHLDLHTPVQVQQIPPGLVRAPGPIAIYHSHNDESYLPTQGTWTIDNGPGGIHAVGDALARQLEENGFTVHKSDALHQPHDRGAYRRSRRTALELLTNRPAAIFDVHRDATPPDVYSGVVDGERIARIRIVVGMQNPNYLANRAFAAALRDIGNRLHPGLMLGLYFGRGGYNQDLSPRASLVEAGAHTNRQEEAIRGIMLFGNAVASYFGLR